MFSQDQDLLIESKRRQAESINFSGVIFARQSRVSISDCICDLEIIAKLGELEEFVNSVSSEVRSSSRIAITGDRTKFPPSPFNTNHLLQSRHNFHQIRLLTHHLLNRLISPRNLI